MNEYDKKTEHAIDVYVEEFRHGDKRTFHMIRQKGLEKEILYNHFVNKKTIRQLSEEFGLTPGTISGFITDYKLKNYDDTTIEELALLDSENHLGIMAMFFSNAIYLSKEASLTSVLARKLREEIAMKVSEEGVLSVAKDKDMMAAWGEISKKTLDYSANAGKFMETYLKLMEKVLDKQRELAFVKVLYDVIQKLEPEVAEKLHEALANDDYARAVLQSMSGEALLKHFMDRSKNMLPEEASYTDDILLN